MARILKTRLQFAKLKKKSGESEPTYGNEIQIPHSQLSAEDVSSLRAFRSRS